MATPPLLARLHAAGIMAGWVSGGVSLRALRSAPDAPADGTSSALQDAQRDPQPLRDWLAAAARALGAHALWTSPLSEEQRGLWIAGSSASGDQAQLIELTLRWLPGDGEPPTMDAVVALARRHPMLAALVLPGHDEPLLCFTEPAPVPARTLLDLRHLDALAAAAALRCALQAHALRPFAMHREPGLRVLQVLEPGGGVVMQLVRHHLVSDGWSLGLILRDLSAIDAAFRQGRPVPVPQHWLVYAEHACRQRAGATEERACTQSSAVARALSGRRVTTFAPGSGAQRPDVLRKVLDGRPVYALARRLRATPFSVACALFSLTLGWQLGRRELVFATDVSTRCSSELEACVGTFVNRAVLALEVPPEGSLQAYVEEVAARVQAAAEGGGVPYAQTVRALRRLGGEHGPALPDVVFGMHAEPRHAPFRHLGRPELVALDTVCVHQPMSFYLSAEGERLHLELRHDSAVVPGSTARLAAQGLDAVLTTLGAEEQGDLAALRRVVNACLRPGSFGRHFRGLRPTAVAPEQPILAGGADDLP
jgi:hypothetical protein